MIDKIEHIKQGQTVYISYRGEIEKCIIRGEIEKCIMRRYTKLHSMYAVYLYIPSQDINMCYLTDNGRDIFLNEEEVFNYLIKYKRKR